MGHCTKPNAALRMQRAAAASHATPLVHATTRHTTHRCPRCHCRSPSRPRAHPPRLLRPNAARRPPPPEPAWRAVPHSRPPAAALQRHPVHPRQHRPPPLPRPRWRPPRPPAAADAASPELPAAAAPAHQAPRLWNEWQQDVDSRGVSGHASRRIDHTASLQPGHGAPCKAHSAGAVRGQLWRRSGSARQAAPGDVDRSFTRQHAQEHSGASPPAQFKCMPHL